MEALDECRDEGIAGAETVDDLDGMARNVDLSPFVEQQGAALPALQNERAHTEREQCVRVSGGGSDLFLVADHDVRVRCSLPRELAVVGGPLPERGTPVEVED